MTINNKKPLRQNPFTAYRDPITGQWLIVLHSASSNQNYSQGSK